MYGAPGTGKTRLALALSNEAGVNFVKLNGLEMESKWAGESEANWKVYPKRWMKELLYRRI